MKSLPKVSIVIACYNDPYVVKAVESAQNQSYKNREIIVVDDGSKPAIKKILADLRTSIDILIVQENQGQSIARNNGIKKATGEYILNLDSDDYFEESFCEKAVKIFEEEDGVKIVTCKARRFNRAGDIDIFTPRGGDLNNFLFSNSALGSAMFKKCDWQKSGGYEEDLPILGYEDWEFYISLLKSGGSAYVIPEVLFNYQVRKGSTTSRIQHLKHEKLKEIILKHSSLYRENFSSVLEFLISKIDRVEKEKVIKLNSLEFKIGKFFLRPVKFFKRKLF